MTPLEGEALRALLHDAVDDVRPLPDGYERIRAGIARRQRWRIPAFAAGAAALAGIAAVAFIAVRPNNSTQLVEPASSVSSSIGPDGHVTTVPRTPGAAGGHSAPVGARTSPRTGPTSTTHATATATATAGPTASATGGPPDQNSPRSPARNGDIDGDGQPDSVSFTSAGLSVELSSGGGPIAVALSGLDVSSPHYAITDVDGDGYGEIIVQEGAASAAGTKYGIVRMSDRVLASVSGGPLPLTAGVTASRGDGFACVDGLIRVRSGSSDDGTTYAMTTTTWKLSGSKFTQVGKAVSSTWDSSSGTASPFVAGCGTLS